MPGDRERAWGLVLRLASLGWRRIARYRRPSPLIASPDCSRVPSAGAPPSSASAPSALNFLRYAGHASHRRLAPLLGGRRAIIEARRLHAGQAAAQLAFDPGQDQGFLGRHEDEGLPG